MVKTIAQSAILCVLIVSCGILVCGAEGDNQVETLQHAKQSKGNHLVGESSPYLLQHAYNPVEWYPWGEEALRRARTEDKPIFLSIGYSACHWCHVMEHESFENEEIAALLNDYFVSIKVDREQRPDLDEIYMSFTQTMTGGGGWPMSVFLTPELKPFYAGTYFPPEDRYGRPGFRRIITQLGSMYRDNKDEIVASSEDIFTKVTARLQSSLPVATLNRDMPARAARSLMQGFDHVNGGFGNKPKFPHAVELSLFLRQYRRSGDKTFLDAAELALKAMGRGGIYDHIGGGFARYSTDHRWLVPHFEKMLYDNGLLVPVYAEAYQLTQDEFYREVVRGTLDFLLREMTASSGGLYSTLDADSEGEEGKFYVWTYREIKELLGDDAEPFIEYYNVTSTGNFEGHNILNLTRTSDRVRSESGRDDFDEYLERCRRKLFDKRSERVRPGTDDKILTSWNGLGLKALCSGYSITGDRRYLEAALANAAFVEKELFNNGDLTHAYREGVHSPGLFLEDYAYYSAGLISLYEVSHDDHWVELAATLADRAVTLFMDEAGTFYMRPDRQTDLIVRPKDETDSSVPSPGSIMIGALLKLNRLTGDERFLAAAEKGQRAISGWLDQNPGRMSSAALALDYYFSDKIEIVIVGKGDVRDRMLSEVNRRYLPNKLIAVSDNGHSSLPLFEGRRLTGNDVVAYVCRNSVCQLPVSTVEELKAQLDAI